MHGEIIKRLWCEVNEKRKFCFRLEKHVGTKGLSILNHWFGGEYLNIPEKHMKITERELRKTIKKQIKNNEEALKLQA